MILYTSVIKVLESIASFIFHNQIGSILRMMQRFPKDAFYRIFNFLYVTAMVCMPIVATSSKLTPELLLKFKEWFEPSASILGYIHNIAWWLTLVLGLVAATSKYICTRIGEPWVWATLQTMVEDLRKNAFTANTDGPAHHHRVTVFRHVKWRFRNGKGVTSLVPWTSGPHVWSGWLVPVLRSCHTTQRSKSVFLAPDNGRSEGIAGQTWAAKGTVYKAGLPNLEVAPTKNDIALYAKETLVTTNFIKNRMSNGQTLARSYCGIPVEVKNRLWGVIVLDSMSPNGIKKPRGQAALTYFVMAKFVGKLLERA